MSDKLQREAMLRTVKDLRNGENGWVSVSGFHIPSMGHHATVLVMTDGRVFVSDTAYAFRLRPPAQTTSEHINVRRNDAGDLELLLRRDQEFGAWHTVEPYNYKEPFSQIAKIIMED